MIFFPQLDKLSNFTNLINFINLQLNEPFVVSLHPNFVKEYGRDRTGGRCPCAANPRRGL